MSLTFVQSNALRVIAATAALPHIEAEIERLRRQLVRLGDNSVADGIREEVVPQIKVREERRDYLKHIILDASL